MEPVPWPAGFDDPDWLWQVKWDGVRCLAVCDGGGVRLWSRRGRLRTACFPEVSAELPAATAGAAAILDGEIVSLGADGRPSFHLVMRRAMRAQPGPLLRARIPVVYAVFDALAWDGDLRARPALERLQRLDARLRPSAHVIGCGRQLGGGAAFVRAAAAAGLEGAVAKRAASAYVAGRSRDWRKVKPRRTARALVVGYRASPGGRLRSLALALPVEGGLVYVGDVGSGWTEAERERLGRLLRGAGTWSPPFATPGPAPGAVRRWVTPCLLAEVTYAELTPQGLLRAPVLAGTAPLPPGTRLW